MLRGGHEPGTRLVRDARGRPPLERGDQGVLREILGQPNVADDPRETGDEPGGFDPPNRVDRTMGIGSRHGYQSGRCKAEPRCDYGFAVTCVSRSVLATVTDYRLAAAWARRRSSCSLSSGVSAGPKSSASNTWRISISDSVPGKGLGARLTHSIASSFDFT
jgi:hypothetical protein